MQSTTTQSAGPIQAGPIQTGPIQAGPYQNESLNRLYTMLFCDTPAVYRQDTPATEYPWTTLLATAPDRLQLEAIAADQSLETRLRLLAYHRLAENGATSVQHKLMGVILEVGLPDGLDVVAAYADGTARYLNHAERLLIWDTRTNESDQLIGQLFAHGQRVVSHIGRWEGERRPFPANGLIRLNFLASDGLYFGEGPFEALYADPMGAPVINAGIQLMDYLIRMGTSPRD